MRVILSLPQALVLSAVTFLFYILQNMLNFKHIIMALCAHEASFLTKSKYIELTSEGKFWEGKGRQVKGPRERAMGR